MEYKLRHKGLMDSEKWLGRVKEVALPGKQWRAATERGSRWYNLKTSIEGMSLWGMRLAMKRK